MVFGVFDSIHEGHRHFFREAKEFGDYLIAVVAADEVAKALKGKHPKKDLAERIAEIEEEIEVDEVLVGDEEMGSWDIIKRIRPHVIAVGYDQKAMKKNLEDSIENFNWFIEIETVSAHKPEKYHSSIINRNS
ncbi:MAG: adenylyltransferase/cytidyltransferase family protein [Candidatus Liptonbacteria bacterium]|nr:adenylyltransferase/cytidyltransferase family protein [Candidatus Liptonbacteria bacterium]